MNSETSFEMIDEKEKEILVSKSKELIEKTNYLIDNDPDTLYNESKLYSDEIKPFINNEFLDEELTKIYLMLASRMIRIFKRTYKVTDKLDLNFILNFIASIPNKSLFQAELLDVKVSLVSYYLSNGEHKKGIETGKLALDEAYKLKNDSIIYPLLINIGQCCWQSSDNPSALRYFMNAIEISKKLPYSIEHYKPYNNAGNIFLSTGVMTEALTFFLKALKIAEDFNDSFAKSIVYLNLGIYYHDMDDLGKTLEYYQKSLDERKRTTNKTGLSQTLANLSSLYLRTKEYEKANEYALLAFGAAKETKSKMELMNAHTTLAYAEIYVGKLQSAKENLEVALKLSNEVNSLFGKHQAISGFAEISKDNFEEHLKYLLEAYEIAKKLDDKRLIAESCKHLSETYEDQLDFRKALEYLKEMSEVMELIRNEENQSKTALLQSDFDFKQAKQKAEILSAQNEELSKLNVELQKLNSDKNDFLNIAAHDLRNPLSSVISSCDFILSNYSVNDFPRDVYDLLVDINTSSENMLELINQLLDLNKIEEGNFGVIKENFDLLNLLNLIKASFEKVLIDKRQQLTLNSFGSILNIYSDKNIIKQILINLISNASKYSPLGSEIVINVIPESNNIAIKIKDSGPGFPKYMKNDVFKKFSGFANKPTGGESSTGLGLSIIKKLTDLLGGEIFLESSSPNGSVFKFIIPLE